VLTLALLWGAAALALDGYGRREPRAGERFDLIVVAGCRVMPDGRPSRALRRRVERAVGLWRQGRAPALLFTGGVGDAPVSEARASAALAASLGVPAAAMILEERSTTTEENARLAAALAPGARVLVVSDTFHVLRCERVFARHFAAARGVGSRNDAGPRARGALREVAALSWYALRGRL
jgi:uncharacterized SAM-binding protein YcdF (DUF218 family)